MNTPASVRGSSQTAAVEVFGRDDIVGYRRSPSDVIRLILFGLATILLLVTGQVPHWLGIEYRQLMPALPRRNEAKVNP